VPKHRFYGYNNQIGEAPSFSCTNCYLVVSGLSVVDRQTTILNLAKKRLPPEKHESAERIIQRYFERRERRRNSKKGFKSRPPHVNFKKIPIFTAVDRLVKIVNG
jgi:hypothetical protein